MSAFALPVGNRIAVVGTREPTPEIQLAVRQFVVALTYEMSGRTGVTIISGGARGVDEIATATACHHGLTIVEHRPQKYMPAQEPICRHPKQAWITALMRRNSDIVNDCEWLVAFPGHGSRGTWDAIRKAINAGKLWEVRRA